MNKIEQLYEGKAKKVYSTEDPNVVIVSSCPTRTTPPLLTV